MLARLAPTQDEQVVQAQLKALAPLEREVTRREALRCLPRVEAMVLMHRHPRDESQPREEVHDAIDGRFGHGEHNASARPQHRCASRGGFALRSVVEVLEDGEHGDRVELTAHAQVIGERAAHQTHSLVLRLRRESRIDADPAGDAIRQHPEESAVGAAHIEDERALGNVRRGLRDAPALQGAIDELH